MRKTILLLIGIASVMGGRVAAQSVVATAGGGNETLVWTLGEVFTESVMRSNVVRFSQGFNQPFVAPTSGIFSVKNDNLDLTVAPNPVADELYLTLSEAGNSAWYLYDLQGRLLDSGRLPEAQQAVIAFSDREAGEYILKVENEKGARSVLILKK